MNARTLCAAASAAAIALSVAACGDDEGDDESASTGADAQEQPAPAGGAAQTVKLGETEYKITPSSVDLQKGGAVKFDVANKGQQTHALEVESEDGELEEETGEIGPGESASLELRLGPGTYELYCPIGNHKEQGMTGELTVAGGSGASSGETGDDNGGDDDSSGSGY